MQSDSSDADIDCLLQCRLPMPAENSAAAIIFVDSAEYLMQLRDRKTGIYYPGYWGLFGGAVERDEGPEETLRRELKEELGFFATDIRFVTEFNFDLAVIGEKAIYRKFYEVRVTRAHVERFVLGEGQAMATFTPRNLFASRLTPYDSFALWLHYLKWVAPSQMMASPLPVAK